MKGLLTRHESLNKYYFTVQSLLFTPHSSNSDGSNSDSSNSDSSNSDHSNSDSSDSNNSVIVVLVTYFSKNNLTPQQPVRCSHCSVLQFSRCFI